MKTMTKDRIFKLALLTYMVAVSLFGYVVLSAPPEAEAQAGCVSITWCAATSGGCCASGGTGSVYTGSRYGGPHYYSEICMN